MKNRKQKVLNNIFEEDKNNLSILDVIQKHQIIKVINCYQNYVNRFINVSNEDVNNLYKIINDK
tara:strand:+ start:676 stop:867 length:192 start_codon:yes stop_codon:yes gene_type:complete